MSLEHNCTPAFSMMDEEVSSLWKSENNIIAVYSYAPYFSIGPLILLSVLKIL